VRERDRFLALRRELVVHHVEHLEERHVRAEILRRVIDKPPGLVRTGLPPGAEGDAEGGAGVVGDHGRQESGVSGQVTDRKKRPK
jgi:hypothetical protein